jgi:hypothetical protein
MSLLNTFLKYPYAICLTRPSLPSNGDGFALHQSMGIGPQGLAVVLKTERGVVLIIRTHFS